MVAGLFEALLSRLLPRLRLLFPPLICGFIVAAVGLELGLIGISHLLDVSSGSEAALCDTLLLGTVSNAHCYSPVHLSKFVFGFGAAQDCLRPRS